MPISAPSLTHALSIFKVAVSSSCVPQPSDKKSEPKGTYICDANVLA